MQLGIQLLKNNCRSTNQVIIADLNGDERPEIVTCAKHGNYELRWQQNEGREHNVRPALGSH